MQKPIHILVIRLSAMGDVAMSVPVIKALIQQHPNCKVTLLSKPFLAPLFKGLPNVSFYAADVTGKHKGFLGLYRLYKELKNQEITHVADLHNVLRSKILRFFFSFSNRTIASIDKGRAEKKALTREHNKIFKQLKTSHQRYTDVFKTIGFQVDITKPLSITDLHLSEKVKKVTGDKKNSWIGIAPFAAFIGKVYPWHLMKQVIETLSEQEVTLFLFGGGKKEISLLKDIEQSYKSTVNIAGKLSFEEELQLISHLDVMLSMDSGNAHLAAMQAVKTITVWGVTHPYAGFAPFNQPEDYCILPNLKKYPKLPCSVYGNKVYDGYEKVMESIPVEVITSKVLSVMHKKRV